MLMYVVTVRARVLLTNNFDNRKSVTWPGSITLTLVSIMEMAPSHPLVPSHSMRLPGKEG